MVTTTTSTKAKTTKSKEATKTTTTTSGRGQTTRNSKTTTSDGAKKTRTKTTTTILTTVEVTENGMEAKETASEKELDERESVVEIDRPRRTMYDPVYKRWADDGTSAYEIARCHALRDSRSARAHTDRDDVAENSPESLLHDIGSQVEVTLVSADTQTNEGGSVENSTECCDEMFEANNNIDDDPSSIEFAESLRMALAECEATLLVRSVYNPLDDEFAHVKSMGTQK